MKVALWRVARYSPLGSNCKLGCLVRFIQKAKGLPLRGLPVFGGTEWESLTWQLPWDAGWSLLTCLTGWVGIFVCGARGKERSRKATSKKVVNSRVAAGSGLRQVMKPHLALALVRAATCQLWPQNFSALASVDLFHLCQLLLPISPLLGKGQLVILLIEMLCTLSHTKVSKVLPGCQSFS